MIYKKLKRTRTFGYAEYIPNLREVFPEIAIIDDEDLARRFKELKLDFYHEVETPVNPLIRLTLPFAVLLLLGTIVSSPIKFIITGSWSYDITDSVVYNWFKSLRLI